MRTILLVAAALSLCACASTMETRRQSNLLDFLYSGPSAEWEAASDVTLQLPVRVGLAFAPSHRYRHAAVSEDLEQKLLEQVAASFRQREEIRSIEVVPSTYLKPEGGFANLDQVASAFGVDLMVLVAYDQIQFTDRTEASILYWTIVGSYLIKGEKHETRTVLEAAVYDIPSRALLFRASGDSAVKGRATPVRAEERIRDSAEDGIQKAIDSLIPNLDTSLAEFAVQAKTGTLRGEGTPGIRIQRSSGSGGGAGASGLLEVAGMLLLAAGALVGWRLRPDRRLPAGP